MAKVCKDCKKLLPLSEFHSVRLGKPTVRARCKKCENLRSYNYRKTKDGIITQIYHMQKQSSKTRKHPLPSYSKQELRIWMFAQPQFDSLYRAWVESGYLKDKSVSCDRIDTLKPYTLDNLQLLSFKQNHLNENRDMRKGIIGRAKKVVGFHKITGKKVVFVSASEASRQLLICKSDIRQCCCDKRLSAGNYIWRYAE